MFFSSDKPKNSGIGSNNDFPASYIRQARDASDGIINFGIERRKNQEGVVDLTIVRARNNLKRITGN
jgi:hypothetical protein